MGIKKSTNSEEEKYLSSSDGSVSNYSFSELTEKEKAQINKDTEAEYHDELESSESHYKKLVQ